MSRLTPVEEYAAGIVSFASQAPLAKRKKSLHAFALRSMNAGSMTLSGGTTLADGEACATASCGRRATEAAVAATRDQETDRAVIDAMGAG